MIATCPDNIQDWTVTRRIQELCCLAENREPLPVVIANVRGTGQGS